MNNRAKIFVATHRDYLKTDNRDKELNLGVDGANQPTRISRILLRIAHAYIQETGSDQSDYWMSFVFDVCASVGLCSERYIDHLASKQKRDYILQSLSHVGGEDRDEHSVVREIALTIYDYLVHGLSSSVNQGHGIKATVDAMLAFAHNLTSIDRSIEDCEERFFRELRRQIYYQVGWQPRARIALSVNQPDARPKEEFESNDSGSLMTALDDAVSGINSLIGLQKIKAEVQSLINSLQVQRLRAEAGLPDIERSNHMVFFGNPGTGKTTIARKLGDIYRFLGILSKGHFVETDRSGLVAGYLGQTAIKTTEVLDRAKGGILFVDEAYSLSPKQTQDQYGQEAIDTLLKYMEDHRENLVVIVAGYQDLMEDFLGSNPGLRSRFNKYFFFEDYGHDELFGIFRFLAEKGQYIISRDAEERLRTLLIEMVEMKTRNFANGRAIRNFFERTLAKSPVNFSRGCLVHS